MANAVFDTLTTSKELQDAGIEPKHAEAIALAVKQGQGELATKQDIELVKQDIELVRVELKSDISWIKWVVGANLAISLVIVSAIIALW